jgi:hypothetical protein
MITYRIGKHTGRGSERESCVYAEATGDTYAEADYGYGDEIQAQP